MSTAVAGATGYIYFIDTADGQFVKIGYSVNVKRRLSELQVSSPCRLTLRGVVPGNREYEKGIHDIFSDQHVSGEWFRRVDWMDDVINDLDLTGIQDNVDNNTRPRLGPLAVVSTCGVLSAVAEMPQRKDWSVTRKKLEALEPGDVVIFTCPPGISMPAFRSTIITMGRRLSFEGLKICTRTRRRDLHCFLGPLV